MSARPAFADLDLSLPPAPPLADPGLPERIGKYRVLSRLGEGATSEVFLAVDEFHHRNVAIKRVRAATLGESVENHYRERFYAAEAALAGKLVHPTVAQFFGLTRSQMVHRYVQLHPEVAAETLSALLRTPPRHIQTVVAHAQR